MEPKPLLADCGLKKKKSCCKRERRMKMMREIVFFILFGMKKKRNSKIVGGKNCFWTSAISLSTVTHNHTLPRTRIFLFNKERVCACVVCAVCLCVSVCV